MSVEWWNTVGTWFSGFATLSAVLLLLWLQRRSDKRGRPSLKVGLEPDSVDCIRYVYAEFAEQNEQREELWIRVSVENTGENAARDVEVRLLSIHRAGDPEPQSRSNLWFKAASLNSASINLLPRGIKQHFDIGFARHLVSQAHKLSFYLVIVKPDLEPWPDEKKRIEHDNRDNKLDTEAAYTLRIAALSSNADAVFHNFSIRLDVLPTNEPTAAGVLGEQSFKRLLTLKNLPQSANQH